MRKFFLGIIVLALVGTMSGCGKDKDLVMVTTESTTIEEEATMTDAERRAAEAEEAALATTENNEVDEPTEEATAEEKAITLEDIYNANTGDALLSGSQGYSNNLIYYYEGVETYSEYYYIGFDENGEYFQAYENSDGDYRVLNNEEMYWYYYDADTAKQGIRIYSDPNLSNLMVEYNHTDIVYSKKTGDQTEQITDVYRRAGNLIVETLYSNGSDSYTFEYVLNDNKHIICYSCFDSEGEMITYSLSGFNAEYVTPDYITSCKNNELLRTVTLDYVDESIPDISYQVPMEVAVDIEYSEYIGYEDEMCTDIWESDRAMDNGYYNDTMVYVKKLSE